MRILFVLPYAPSHIRVRPFNFIRELAKCHEISVLASALGQEPDDYAVLQASCQKIDIMPVSVPTSVRNCVAAGASGKPLQSAVSQHPALGRRIRDLLATGSFDVVHIEHLRAAHVAPVIPPDVPTLFDAVDCISLLLERTRRDSHSLLQRTLARFELPRTRAYEASLMTRFDQMIVSSPDDARALEALAPSRKVAIVTNGVELEYLCSTGGQQETATLVLSGKMSYHANVTAAIHFVRNILPRIRTTRPDVRLRIVGSNPPPIVRALTRDPAITVTGYVPDMAAALQGATIAVCPIIVKVGVQNKLLEAMAMSIPVVSTRIGVQGLSAAPGRDLLVGDTDSEFADHVCRLLAQSDLRVTIGQAGRRYVEDNHRWDVLVRKLETYYSEAIAHRARALASHHVDAVPGTG